MSNCNPSPARRWFRFSLRTLLIAMAVVSAMGGYAAIAWRKSRAEWREAAAIYQERCEALTAASQEVQFSIVPYIGGVLRSRTPGVSKKRVALGDFPREAVVIDRPMKPATEKRFRAAFPETTIRVQP